MEIKIGAKKDGTIVAAKQVLKFQAGAFRRARRSGRAACAASPCMTCRTSMSSATTWSAIARRSRPIAPRVRRSRPSRSKAPWTIWPTKLGMDPLTLREKNAAKNGTKTHYGPVHQNIGFTAGAGRR